MIVQRYEQFKIALCPSQSFILYYSAFYPQTAALQQQVIPADTFCPMNWKKFNVPV